MCRLRDISPWLQQDVQLGAAGEAQSTSAVDFFGQSEFILEEKKDLSDKDSTLLGFKAARITIHSEFKPLFKTMSSGL
ncbi:hypothetical protein WISP_50763 [Willisornis vidua]|uniref:Uncharacterized protein n=1 Tax=Willisornis vidua TaxID=1566151 RepID=A0ABQ9DDV7_9PASS|nr:hypothetical protein WISP_50763 [Willisornis vidua]